MDQTHLHLLVTHLPIFGSILGAFVLFYGIWKKNNTTLMAAYYVLIISAIGAGVAYVTGEGAEEAVEHLQGFSEHVIEEHAESAQATLIAFIIVGIMSLAGLFVTLKVHAVLRPVAYMVLLVSVIGFALAARTGYLGGQIRHTEITGKALPSTKNGSDE